MTFLRIVIITYLTAFLLAAFNLGHADTHVHTNIQDQAKGHDHIDNNTILVLGDSLSAAYGIEIKQGWVNLMHDRLDNYSEDQQWNVVNASVSGETTAGGLARLPNIIERHQPVLCIIGLGANNGLRGQPTSLMQDNLQQMISLCENSGTSLLLGIKLPPNYGDKYTQAFHQVYLDLAEQNNILLVPFLLEGIALEDKYLQADRLHPTAEAQELILDNVWPTLCKIIDSF